MFSHLVIGFCPFDELEYSTQKSIRQVFCQKIFLYLFFSIFLGNGTCCIARISGIKSMLSGIEKYSDVQQEGEKK